MGQIRNRMCPTRREKRICEKSTGGSSVGADGDISVLGSFASTGLCDVQRVFKAWVQSHPFTQVWQLLSRLQDLGFLGGRVGWGSRGAEDPLPTYSRWSLPASGYNPYLPTPATLTYHKRKVCRRFGDPLTFSLPGSGVRLALGRLGGRFGDRLGAWLSVRARVRNGDPN